MIDVLKRHVDDVAAVPVETYITMHKKTFPDADRDFSFLRGYETIFVLALSYPKGKPPYKGKGYGTISRYAHGRDYHLVFKEKLDTITAALEKEGVRAEGAVDINPLDERFAAYLAGLGFIGHNRFLIHPKYGTHLYLATLLVDRPFDIQKRALDDCGDCTRCIEACPTDALEVGRFHENRCLSHVTQAKEVLSEKQLSSLKTTLFGCDICQDVCPKNENIAPVNREAFQSDENAQLHLETLLTLSNREIMRRFKHYAFAWRGALVLKRNAIALLHNQGIDSPEIAKTYKAYKHVEWFEKTIRPLIKEECA